MVRSILITTLFLLSLLTIVRAPTNLLWYISILITEFSIAFIILVILLLVGNRSKTSVSRVVMILGIASIVLLSIPIVGAYRLSRQIQQTLLASNDEAIEAATSPFSVSRMVDAIIAKQVTYKTVTYDTANNLTLDFYPAAEKGVRPCIIVIHGGSWAGGDSRQLPELNSILATEGYHVAAINYRLAPKHQFPAPVTDVKETIQFLKAHAASLAIDTNKIVLLGRSAGAQIALTAAYTLTDPGIKGVINFYGPTDMVWGYANPTNPLVLDSRKVMERYLGGTFNEVPHQYRASSPTITALNNAVATLSLYAENDPLVSHLHGPRLAKALDVIGAKHYEIYLPWATHGFDWTIYGPAGQISTWSVLQFVRQVTGA